MVTGNTRVPTTPAESVVTSTTAVARSLCGLRRWAVAVVKAAKHTSASSTLARNLLLLYKFIDPNKHGKTMEVNDKAPEFSLANEEGKPIALKDYRGKNVVLFFYPKANTPG
jgi:hypothetical protein